MKFQWTPKPRTASVEDLREQLSNAEASYQSAKAATQTAEIAFDDAGEATAEKALLAARSVETIASEHLARAKRLMTAAEAEAAVRHRSNLERRATELQSELQTDPEGARLDAEQADAFAQVVEKKLQRLAHNMRRGERQQALDNVRRELGQSAPFHYFDPLPSHASVAECLQALALKTLNPTARTYLARLAAIDF